MITNNKGITQPTGPLVEDLFEQVFKSHFKSLHAYASTIIRDPDMGEEIVQQIFVKLWEKKEELDIRENISAYLYRAVHNDCINYLRHLKVRAAYQSHTMRQNLHAHQDKPPERIVAGELESKLREALRELPEQCRTIFQLSRFEELKYREIADKMGLSVKTIENQMGKALRILRLKLADFLVIIFILATNIFK